MIFAEIITDGIIRPRTKEDESLIQIRLKGYVTKAEKDAIIKSMQGGLPLFFKIYEREVSEQKFDYEKDLRKVTKRTGII